nr:hypothetical protein [Marinicella sp. W31]MDC2875992.1 hypothetical protein [Marinicella sp. W31]
MNRKQRSGMMSGNTEPSTARRSGFNPLHEAAQKLAEYARFQGRYKARELVGLLTSQGERAARAVQPAARIHLFIQSEKRGRAPVSLRLR